MIKDSKVKPMSGIFDGKSLWLVPTFQRPYAWEADKHAQRLFDDVTQAFRSGIRDYYLSPIHVIEVSKNEAGKKLLSDFISGDLGLPLPLIPTEAFQNEIGGIMHDVTTYLVIDGQQRLLTCYIALLLAGRLTGGSKIQNGGISIPLVVPGSPEELSVLNSQSDITNSRDEKNVEAALSASRAAQKIMDLFRKFQVGENQMSKDVANFFHNKVKLLQVELESEGALSSFLTLNDRGKPLSILEKFKAHALYLLQMTPAKSAELNPQVLHNAFGEIYRSLDIHGTILTDERAIQILGCCNIEKLDQPAAEWGASKWYDDYISLQETVPVHWPDDLTSIAEFNRAIGNLRRTPRHATVPPKKGARPVEDLVEVIFDRSYLNHRVLTIVYLLRKKFPVSFDGNFGILELDNKRFYKEIENRIVKLKIDIEALDAGSKTLFYGWMEKVDRDLLSGQANEKREVTLLQLARMLNLTTVKQAQFKTCIMGIQGATDRTVAMKAVEHYLTVHSGRNYLLNFLQPGDTSRDSAFYMLVLDYESSLGRNWSLSSNDSVEHIFASQGYQALHNNQSYGFTTETQFNDIAASVGNILPLEKSLNSSIGENDLLVKADYYVSQKLISGKSVLPPGVNPKEFSPSAVEVGNRLKALGLDYRAHKLLVELRTIEMTLHAVKTL